MCCSPGPDPDPRRRRELWGAERGGVQGGNRINYAGMRSPEGGCSLPSRTEEAGEEEEENAEKEEARKRRRPGAGG